MTDDDIVAGKGGFQKADLMDYGSLYGMGSYYGEDYTASTLVRSGHGDAEQCRAGHVRQALRERSPPTSRPRPPHVMRRELQGMDLTKPEVVLPRPVGGRRGHGARRPRQVAERRQSRYRLDAGLQPHAAARAPDGGFPGVLRADDGGAAAGRHLVLDRELAL